jgi:hypothetical protein
MQVSNKPLSLHYQTSNNMKAIQTEGQTFKVTGTKGDFTICEDSKGKVRMFATHKIEIIEIEAMPSAKKFNSKGRTSAEKLAEKLYVTAGGGFDAQFSSLKEKEDWLEHRQQVARESMSSFR